MSLLINTYLKALRQEKVILRANLYSLAFSFLLGLYAMLIVHHLTLAVLNIVIVYAFRSLYCEYQLQKSIPFVYWKDWILELGLVSLFILSNLTLNGLFALSLYLCALIIYLLCKKKDYLCRKRSTKVYPTVRICLDDARKRPDSTDVYEKSDMPTDSDTKDRVLS